MYQYLERYSIIKEHLFHVVATNAPLIAAPPLQGVY